MSATGAFTFAPFREEHVALMRAWLARPHVAEWWDDRTSIDEIREDYLTPSDVRPFVVYLDDRPIGFIQSYFAHGAGDGWWEFVDDPGVVGIDQFIGEPELIGRGLGTAMISAFVARLFEDPVVTRVQIDPSPDNRRAIRCYEKVGFRGEGVVETPDGPAWYMTLDRSVLEERPPRR